MWRRPLRNDWKSSSRVLFAYFHLSVLVVDCSKPLVKSTAVTKSQRHTADRVLQQTKPDDPKFVGRLKTLNLGVSRRHQSSRGLIYSRYFYLFAYGVIFKKLFCLASLWEYVFATIRFQSKVYMYVGIEKETSGHFVDLAARRASGLLRNLIQLPYQHRFFWRTWSDLY